MWATRHTGKRAPSTGVGVKEERRNYGRILGKDTEKGRRATVLKAVSDESFGEKEEFP